jgi:hypothetical protein
MPGIVLAWLAGEGIIIYRSWKKDGRPPMPGQLLASSALFAALGLLAEAPNARFLAGALAWGFDIAAFMNLAPTILTGATNTEKKAAAA